MDEETIVALATPPGRGGIAVVRLSGSQSEAVLGQIFQGLPRAPRPRHSYHGHLHDAGRRIDECLAVLFRGPRSYSGEDMAEISLHANPFIVEAAVSLACRCGARPALAGEFSYRAFRNGKLDLLQAEAVNELIRSNSRAFSLMEFGNLEGRLSREVAGIRRALLKAAVDVETGIEFSEDQHVAAGGGVAGLAGAAAALDGILAGSRFSEALNRGLRVAIAGRVNVGKSSLFNALLLKERSITSALPGTTRDYIEETLRLDGFSFRLTDMAGLRPASADDVEHEGMRRSLEQIARADAVLFMVDASRPPGRDDVEIHRLTEGKRRLLLANKSDLAREEALRRIRERFPGETPHLVSARSGDNLGAVTAFLKELLRDMPDPSGAVAVNLRQKTLLERLRETLRRILDRQAGTAPEAELLAEEIRRGLDLIGELTGAVSAEDVLHGVFASFCIGK
ncbi:MAG: tRNA uridine-5-carboxymethylaminomethyl(34) synthesis GTPase MnmE [Candidatus Aminicenantes bacterium]|nr:tRNA uridine-5-carboxymethylaminomethyl(34) synthesis GTPase MnmE [Candidatus Aminicenantes bacterium]